jgi:isopentenyldiphosphate isomerase
MSKGAWAFISSGLFYILFALYFGFEFIRNRRKRKEWLEQHKDEEWFDIVDEKGRVKGKAPRSVCHSDPGMLHPVVHVHIIDSKDRIFLQKRSVKKQVQPGKWDSAIGGHISSGESVESGIKREAAEELGITNFNVQFVAKYVWKSDIESELVFMFVSRYNKAITINKQEIEEGKFWRIKKIKESLGKGIFTPNFECEFDILLKHFFKAPAGSTR